jgi:hypothetical protein
MSSYLYRGNYLQVAVSIKKLEQWHVLQVMAPGVA